jgi:uncharacterized membrane protein YjjP (DUF1212 family)
VTDVPAAAARPADGLLMRRFVLELGRALSLAGAPVSETQERLTRVARANGVPDARVVVLPTALLISLGRGRPSTIEAIPQHRGGLRLDQISALYDLVRGAERGVVTPADGLARLRAVHRMRPRYGVAVTLLGHTLMTTALCLILQPTPWDVAVAAVLGAIVGGLLLLARGHHTTELLIPVVSAMTVSAVSFEAVKLGLTDPGLRTLIAALVTFLPGGVLTTATLELASGQMVAGASRLVFGAVQMLLLAFGIVAGAELVGLPDAVAADPSVNLLGWWAPWLGVVVFGAAASLYFSAPRGTLGWLLLVLLTAWLGQLLGHRFVGADVSGFFGALAMTPVALAISRLPGGPPSQVTFLPAFWLLVPGAVGLVGVTEVVSDPAAAGLEDLVQPVASIVAIALGVLCGASASRSLASATRRIASLPGHLRSVRLTLGRPGRGAGAAGPPPPARPPPTTRGHLTMDVPGRVVTPRHHEVGVEHWGRWGQGRGHAGGTDEPIVHGGRPPPPARPTTVSGLWTGRPWRAGDVPPFPTSERPFPPCRQRWSPATGS